MTEFEMVAMPFHTTENVLRLMEGSGVCAPQLNAMAASVRVKVGDGLVPLE